MRGARVIGAVLIAVLTLVAPSVASACARDGVPSMSVDGRLVVLNRSVSVVVPSQWSPFVVVRPIPLGRSVTLAENNREVARALPADVFRRPWRWSFGDHTGLAYGNVVRHEYRKAGTYRVAVSAFYPVYGAWQPFDYAIVHVS